MCLYVDYFDLYIGYLPAICRWTIYLITTIEVTIQDKVCRAL